MQSGTTLLRSSKSVTNNLEILVSTRARQVVEFGEVKTFVMEYYADIMMSVCLAVVVLSCRSHTIDVYQF